MVNRHEDVKAVYKDNIRFLNGPVGQDTPRTYSVFEPS